MASITAPLFPSPSSYTDPNPCKLPFGNPTFLASSHRHSLSPFKITASRVSGSFLCHCQNPSSDAPFPDDDESVHRRWDSVLHDVMKSAVKRWDEYMNSFRNSGVKEITPMDGAALDGWEKEKALKKVEENVAVDWDWERWKWHFEEIEEQERIVSLLKSQLDNAVSREDYEDAAKLKIAIAAASTSDTAGSAILDLNKAVEEEQYQHAAFIRDHAGAGLVGWWAGVSEDSVDPYGRIIHISAEHGRYVARSYSSRQLAAARPGFPLFEIYFTLDGDGQYKHQAVYLKQKNANSGDFPKKPSKLLGLSSLNPLNGPTDLGSDMVVENPEDADDVEERDDDSDVADVLGGIQNVLRDMIPGVKVRVVKVVSPGKVDRDLISKVVEQIMEEDDEKDELESVEPEDDVETGSDSEEIEIDSTGPTSDTSEESSEMSVKVVVGDIMQNMSVDETPEHFVRVPAMLERRGHLSFSFSIKQDDRIQEPNGKVDTLPDKVSTLPVRRNANLVLSDLAKALANREKISMKVLKDVWELISLTVSQDQNNQPLRGATLFNRIQIPTTSDPFSGLYISAHRMFNSEVLHLRRKFGQWQEDGRSQKPTDLEFYEYVEALKLTGDISVPAGQVAFRAKVGKQYLLPHKGIIPEEFGVVARYKGQGRLADPGFRNPRWVDGELVILEGKFIRRGPVIGFVYLAPEYHFLVFFNRLKLQD